MGTRQKGQTILEAIVVVGIVAVFVSAIVVLSVITLHSVAIAKHRSKATTYARAGIEQVRSLRDGEYTSFKEKNGKYCLNASFIWTSTTENCPLSIDNYYSRTVTLDWSSDPDTVNVSSDVMWHEGGGDKHVVLETKLQKRGD